MEGQAHGCCERGPGPAATSSEQARRFCTQTPIRARVRQGQLIGDQETEGLSCCHWARRRSAWGSRAPLAADTVRPVLCNEPMTRFLPPPPSRLLSRLSEQTLLVETLTEQNLKKESTISALKMDIQSLVRGAGRRGGPARGQLPPR